MNKFFPSSRCESLRKCVIPHTTEPVEAARRAVDDVATMGEDELNDRRQLVQASGLAVGQRCAAVSALRPHAHHHDTMSSLPLLGRACAHSVRYHYHLLMDPDCAGIRSLSSEMRSRRLGLITERTGDRPLAAASLESDCMRHQGSHHLSRVRPLLACFFQQGAPWPPCAQIWHALACSWPRLPSVSPSSRLTLPCCALL